MFICIHSEYVVICVYPALQFDVDRKQALVMSIHRRLYFTTRYRTTDALLNNFNLVCRY